LGKKRNEKAADSDKRGKKGLLGRGGAEDKVPTPVLCVLIEKMTRAGAFLCPESRETSNGRKSEARRVLIKA